MFLSKILFVIAVFSSIFVIINSSPIVNGENAGEDEFQFAVAIQSFTETIKDGKRLRTQNRCGGTLINFKVVLTAAHCFNFTIRRMSDYRVKGGIWNLDDSEEEHEEKKFVKVIIHPEYKAIGEVTPVVIGGVKHKVSLPYDIALGVTDSSFNPNKYFIKLGVRSTTPVQRSRNKQLTIIGWGMKASNTLSDVLQKTTLTLLTNAECARLINERIPKTEMPIHIPPEKACLKDMSCGGSGTGQGDSGGLVIDKSTNTIVGVISTGMYFRKTKKTSKTNPNCPRVKDTSLPDVFTDISKFNDWIKTELRKLKKAKLI